MVDRPISEQLKEDSSWSARMSDTDADSDINNEVEWQHLKMNQNDQKNDSNTNSDMNNQGGRTNQDNDGDAVPIWSTAASHIQRTRSDVDGFDAAIPRPNQVIRPTMSLFSRPQVTPPTVMERLPRPPLPSSPFIGAAPATSARHNPHQRQNQHVADDRQNQSVAAEQPGIVPRRSALQIIEHLLNVRPTFSQSSASTSVTATSTNDTAPVLVRRRDLPARRVSANVNIAAVTAVAAAVAVVNMPQVKIAAEPPLALVKTAKSNEKSDVEPLLICLCTPELPGAYWTQAGPMADHDEVDLMTSTSIVDPLHPLRIGMHLPLAADMAVLVRHVDVYRCSESARMSAVPSEWVRCSVLMVPFLPEGRELAEQMSFILESANAFGFERVILPVGRWARNNSNPMDVAHRFTRALETIVNQPPPAFPLKHITISCPPSHSNWALGIQSVIASAKTRRDEEAKIAAAAAAKLTASAAATTTTTTTTTTVSGADAKTSQRTHRMEPTRILTTPVTSRNIERPRIAATSATHHALRRHRHPNWIDSVWSTLGLAPSRTSRRSSTQHQHQR
jgi:hypothetical protein